jgi:hypothetical protein
MQTGKTAIRPVVLLEPEGSSYWSTWERFIRDQLVDGALVSPEDLSFYELARSLDDAIAIIERFYSNYHSARYVGERLIIRLRRKPRQEQLERLSEEFRDVVARGKIHAIGATPEEVRDADAVRFPRIALYATYNYGRIRQLIDALNALD